MELTAFVRALIEGKGWNYYFSNPGCKSWCFKNDKKSIKLERPVMLDGQRPASRTTGKCVLSEEV